MAVAFPERLVGNLAFYWAGWLLQLWMNDEIYKIPLRILKDCLYVDLGLIWLFFLFFFAEILIKRLNFTKL